MTPSDAISIEEFMRAQADGSAIAIIDVREPDEFAAGHIAGALNVPLSRFDPAALPKGKPIVLHCRSGGRSLKALQMARASGVTDIVHFPGGAVGWQAAGGKLTR